MEDIFNRIVEEGKLSDEFRLLSENKLFAPAKALVENIATFFEDKDGRFRISILWRMHNILIEKLIIVLP